MNKIIGIILIAGVFILSPKALIAQGEMSKLSASNELIVVIASQFNNIVPQIVSKEPAPSRWTKGYLLSLASRRCHSPIGPPEVTHRWL